jgi:PAS domain S-box-containing protein
VNSTLNNIEDPRIAEMLDVIFKFAAGDLKARGSISKEDSALDGVMTGINMLGEELEAYVAENKQAEDALRQALDYSQTLIRSSPNGILAVDRNLRITEWNLLMEQMSGTSREQVIGRDLEALPFMKETGEAARIRETIDGKRIEPKEVAYLIPGTDRQGFFASRMAPLQTPAGEILGAVVHVRDITERRRVEQALSESEDQLRTIFDSVQDGILLADAQTRRFRMGNAAMCRMLGYNLDELLNLGMEDLHREEDIAAAARQFERLARGEIRLAQNLPMKRKDGTVFYADINTGQMVVNGAPCLVGVFRDITEGKLQEQALRESQARLDLALQSARMGVWHWDLVENRRHFDAQFCRLLGIDPATFTGTAEEFFGVVHPDDRETLRAAQARTVEQDAPYESEYRAVWPDGSVHYITARGRLIRDDKGRPASINGVTWDITERKRTEQALRESDERFKSILENVVEMFFITDGSLHVIYASPRCMEIYGYDSEEMTARPMRWLESIHAEDRGMVASRAAEELGNGARAVIEYRIVRRDGIVRWLRSISNPLLGADGKLQRVYGTVMDITEFESMRSSLKEKEVLLKEIHHRVKNNLQIVISLMRLESRSFSEERVRAALKDLETRIRAMALVHEHLYHSSDLAKIGFKDYLKGLCEELFRTYRADGGRIALEIDAEAVALDIERAIPCGLIINELLTNAIKYAFPGDRKGVLRVAIRNTSDNEVEIVVGDDGIGMPETLDIRNAKTLGLQLVTTLAENQLKGRVELERASGTRSGTRFRIRFGI